MIPPTDPPPPRRRRFRISLRGLMILVVLVGVPAAWTANRIRTQRRAIAAVRAAGGTILFDYGTQITGTGSPRPRTEPAAPRWLRRWLGDELFQSVRMAYFNDSVSPSILATVAKFDQLETFALNDPADRGDGALHLRGASRLDNLGLEGAWLTDSILNEIAQMSSLQSLRLGKASATDAGFARLGSLPRLRNLWITSCPNLTDAGTARMLAGMPGLGFLDLSSPAATVPTATLAALVRHHPDLEQLTLSNFAPGDDHLAAIGQLGKLYYLSLRSDRITDAGLAHLRSLKGLRRLLVDSRSITDEGLVHLAGMTPLEELLLWRSEITDAGLISLGSLTSLKRLELGNSPAITDAGLMTLQRLPKLEELRLGQTAVTPAAVAALRQAIPALRRVQTQPLPPAAQGR